MLLLGGVGVGLLSWEGETITVISVGTTTGGVYMGLSEVGNGAAGIDDSSELLLEAAAGSSIDVDGHGVDEDGSTTVDGVEDAAGVEVLYHLESADESC